MMGLTRRVPGDVAVLVVLAAAKLLFHALFGVNYGFHRDELQTIDDARHLAWGFVAYPPLTPAVARVVMELFGPSVVALRLVAALAQSAAMVLVGLTARELGGGRRAQLLAAAAVAVAPISLSASTLFQYVTFDYLLWVLAAYCAARALGASDPRWWLGVGAAIGLGLETKYTVGVYVAALLLGFILSPARRQLATPWPWLGGLVALLLWSPNLLWQAQHGLVAIEFTSAIHARDVAIGRTNGFLPEQLYIATNPVSVPLWVIGLYAAARAEWARRWRPLAVAAAAAVALFWLAQGRGYYAGAAYPALFALGAVQVERWIAAGSAARARVLRVASAALVAAGALSVLLLGPFWPIGSTFWNVASAVNTDLREEVGWPELVDQVAVVYGALPPGERSGAAVLAGNYGEAGAISLYGPARRLPTPISPVNSYWTRGYGDPPPRTVVALGVDPATLDRLFASCATAGRTSNPYGVRNEESQRPDIFVCRDPRRPWTEIWPELRRFG